MVKIGCLSDSFVEVFVTASKPSKRSIIAAKRKEKEKKGRGKNSKIEKPEDVDFCACLSQKVAKRDAKRHSMGKKGLAVEWQMHFRPDKANLAEIQPENHQNVRKNAFLAKSSRSQWVNNLELILVF